MEASRLTIRPEALRFTKMQPGRRAKLRKQNIIDLIQSKPAGTPISLREFAVVASLTIGGVHGTLRALEKKNVIARIGRHPKGIIYSVNTAVTVVPPKQPLIASPGPEPQPEILAGGATLSRRCKTWLCALPGRRTAMTCASSLGGRRSASHD